MGHRRFHGVVARDLASVIYASRIWPFMILAVADPEFGVHEVLWPGLLIANSVNRGSITRRSGLHRDDRYDLPWPRFGNDIRDAAGVRRPWWSSLLIFLPCRDGTPASRSGGKAE